MIKKLLFTILSILYICNPVLSQSTTVRVGKISLEISDTKWVYLKFPAKIKYADMGTDDILVEKTKVDNILRVKSVVPVFDETSITIIALDGKIYTFSLHYNQNPKYIAVDLRNVKNNVIVDANAITPMSIELSMLRTSHIILKDNIADISVGVDSIVAELAEDDIMNICKARQVSGFDGFTETSLTIITENKEIFPFIVTHNDNPKDLNINVASGDTDGNVSANFSESTMNEVEMEKLGKEIVEKGVKINNIGVYDDKMNFCLASLYIKNDILMFHIRTTNNSKIDYDVDFIRCYIKNKKNSKSSVSQDDEKIPIYIYKTDEDKILANDSFSEILFFKKFTVPNKHLFYFEMFEKNGGRHLKFTCSNKEILKAEFLGDE
ncbi:MAG TPA: DUF4138 domain-containing protein [Paludibacteraceae bacterium]|nr:DUF4138 domain-containing protein [Paludibacteraceae bacterium]